MIKKEDLEQLESLRKEREDLRERIGNIKNPQNIVSDSVSGSSKSFPYTQHRVYIERFR